MKPIIPYLNFDGTCSEAMRFYRECFGGQLHEMPYDEEAVKKNPAVAGRMLHARIENGDRIIMASDCPPGVPNPIGANVYLSVECANDAEVDALHAKLGTDGGGRSEMAPSLQFWGAYFAMACDRYGVHWMLTHAHPANA